MNNDFFLCGTNNDVSFVYREEKRNVPLSAIFMTEVSYTKNSIHSYTTQEYKYTLFFFSNRERKREILLLFYLFLTKK